MTAEEILDKYLKDSIKLFDIRYVRIANHPDVLKDKLNESILKAMKEFATYCCEKQKEICALEAEELWIADTYCQIDQMCEKIIYSPLPEELL